MTNGTDRVFGKKPIGDDKKIHGEPSCWETPYDKCSDCACYFTNIKSAEELLAVGDGEECSNGMVCKDSFNCPAFSFKHEVMECHAGGCYL